MLLHLQHSMLADMKDSDSRLPAGMRAKRLCAVALSSATPCHITVRMSAMLCVVNFEAMLIQSIVRRSYAR